ncbi:MAG: formate dehydrogenase [Rhodoferax sp.]|nr:formate dehydrogenase [Rhodoferax sp.]
MSQPESKLSRRILFAGVGTAGVVAAVASLVPAVDKTQPLPVQPKAAPVKGGGYSLTDHVKQYYKTTLV